MADAALRTAKRAALALGSALALALLCALPARAATTPTDMAHKDLIVSFTAALSVKVDGLEYSTRTAGPRSAGQTVVPSSATVTNDSTGLTEKFQLHAYDASALPAMNIWSVAKTTGSVAGGVFCSVFPDGAGCPGPDEFALQALFISSANTSGCPTATAADWDQFTSIVSTTPATYTSARFADTGPLGMQNGGTGRPDQSSGPQDGNMYAASSGTDGRGRRGLCVRLTMPSASTTVATHSVRLTVTALVGN